MNILQVNAFQSNTGGGEVFVQKLSNELSLKHKVSILTLSGTQAYNLINESIKKIEVKVWSKFFDDKIPLITEVKSIRKTIRENEILHIHNPFWMLSMLVMLINFKRGKTVCTIHGKLDVANSVVKNSINKLRVMLIFNIFYFLCDRFVFLTNYDLRYFERRTLFPVGRKSVVIGSGCNTSFFSPGKTGDNGKADIFTVLYVGRLSRSKGVYDLLEVIRQLGGENILFKLAGDAKPKDKELKEYLSKEKNVILCGELNHDELKAEYDQCDVFVLPSYSEGFPLTILEAMSMGKPVITTGIYGIPEIVGNKINGLIIKPGDIKALKEAVVFLKNNPEISQKMGRRNEVLVREKYDWQVIARKYESVYAELSGLYL